MKTNEEKFPLTVKSGSAVVRIYQDEKASGTYYRVAYYLGGKRKFQHCDTLDKAKLEADAKAKQLARGDIDAVQITGRDRLIPSHQNKSQDRHAGQGQGHDAGRQIGWASAKPLREGECPGDPGTA
jgi:hypothetical protein